MTDPAFAGVLVSRPDIARLVGVRRPAVTNWERRHADFPSVVDPGADIEQFRADDVLAWLSERVIPANARHEGEAVGTTYGDRFRAGLSGGSAEGLLRTVEQLAGPEADRLRGPMSLDRYLLWLLYLVVNQIVEPDDGLARAVNTIGETVREFDPPEEVAPRRLLTFLADALDRTPAAASAQESRAAFDHVLVLWRAAHAREGGAFFTPPSVSRVMAGALAAVRPGAVRVYDPFGRTGELLVAYLDAVVEQGGSALPKVWGRVPGSLERQVAQWNLRVHHGVSVRLGEGQLTPALDPLADRGAFDVLLTNPPFGRRLEPMAPPPYWTYGVARRTEFDWLQYAVSLLAPEGRAAVLLPAGASFNAGAAETVRAGLVEAGAVECVIALPAGLFTLTAVKTQIWFLRPPGPKRPADAEVLFVSGEHLGRQLTRTEWTLTDDDIARLVGEYASWHTARSVGRPFPGTPGLSRAVPVPDIVDQRHSLDPARYVRPPGHGSAAGAPGPDETRDVLARLSEELASLHARAGAADAEAARRLRRYGL
ncbi:N-6 DNA methylase [Streptomyces sp. NPDC000987]|uniref:N-6 DNA methylase n=1 Tax=Streptomyces sp. NPDC000987 TaxID=3154374 RepID=UPI0033175FF0